jgi:serine/threonine protein kinase
MTIISARSPLADLSIGRGGPFDAANTLEGERLGQFVLQKFIGGGGMGIVFRALDTTLNREVALKVLSRDQSSDDEALRRFRNEAQSAARLDHDNIARVHYVGEDRGVHYIVFEFIEGVNIRDLVEHKGPLPLDEAVSYTYQIAQALDHASQRAVIHRDIKPSNVLITPDGRAKLVDMGLARLNQVAQADNDLTASGVTLGTFDYISPEQARDPRSADVRSDLYSLGCSFFYMLTGRPPFPEGTVLQKLLQHQGDHPPDPRTLRPELPPDVTRILARLLAKNPAHRFQQPSELTAELVALADRLGMPLSLPRVAWTAPRQNAPPRWQHHVPWMLPLAALLVIVFALDRFGPSEVPQEQARVVTLRPGSDGRSRPGDRPQPADATANAKAPAADRPEPSRRPLKTEPASSAPTESEPPPSLSVPRALGDTTTARPSGESNPSLTPASAAVDSALSPQRTSAGAQAVPEVSNQLDPTPFGAPGSERDTSRSEAQQGPPKAELTTERDALLIVSDHDEGPRTYASLRAAAAEAKTDDVIELRFNGRRSEKPFTVSNARITIRAGDGFQPVVLFRPEPNPVEYPPSMMTVAGGNLSVRGVHWELDLPREVPSDWAMVETRRANVVRFERSSMTIRNASFDQSAYHSGVAFFAVKAAPGTATMAMDPAASEDQAVRIELVDFIARGEATLVRASDLQPLALDWDNGLLATSERLLVAGGGALKPSELARHVEINLRHVTAAVHEGLISLSNSVDAPYQLQTQVAAADSIVQSTNHPPLVEQTGSDDVDEFMGRLVWNGERDCFDGFDAFWQIDKTTPPSASKSMAFDEWTDFWGSRLKRASTGPIAWRALPPASRPYHLQTPGDYALDMSVPRNPAARSSTDGLNAGFNLARLPAVPGDERADGGGSRRPASVEKRDDAKP